MQKKIKRILNKISIMMGIDMPRIIFNTDNSFYTDDVIHLKMYDDFNKTLFLALHELRHHYQFIYIKNNNDYISNLLKYEMENYKYLDYKNLYMEMDAYYFSLYVLNNILMIDYEIDNILLDMILKYISEYTFIFGGLYGRCQKNR